MGLRPKPRGDDRVPDPFNDDALIWIEGNTFCCLCSWWHNEPIDYGHLPMLCPRCMDDWLSEQRLRNRVAPVTPVRKKGAKKAS
jgi:hypothetical protein